MRRSHFTLALPAILLLLLTSCANAPYIMEGMARGLAESAYQLEMEQRRQWLIQAEQQRLDSEFRQRMYHYQRREERRQRHYRNHGDSPALRRDASRRRH